jgi:hypothetical protein
MSYISGRRYPIQPTFARVLENINFIRLTTWHTYLWYSIIGRRPWETSRSSIMTITLAVLTSEIHWYFINLPCLATNKSIVIVTVTTICHGQHGHYSFPHEEYLLYWNVIFNSILLSKRKKIGIANLWTPSFGSKRLVVNFPIAHPDPILCGHARGPRNLQSKRNELLPCPSHQQVAARVRGHLQKEKAEKAKKIN